MGEENLTGIVGLNNEVTEFQSGAVRDIQENKGRMDLMPLAVVGDLEKVWADTFLDKFRMTERELSNEIFQKIDGYIYTGNYKLLYEAMINFIIIQDTWCDEAKAEVERFYYAILDISMHYKNGTLKYGERNWEKGIPLHSFIDSAVRHYIKWRGHWKDERHDLAFMWNLMCCVHTHRFIPNKSLQDLPFYNKEA